MEGYTLKEVPAPNEDLLTTSNTSVLTVASCVGSRLTQPILIQRPYSSLQL